MPGPVQILAIVGFLAVLLAVYYVLQVAMRTKEMLLFTVKRKTTSIVLFLLGIPILQNYFGYTPWQSLFASFLLGLTPLAFMRPPRRTRHIPTRNRQTVIARDTRGRGIDPQTHHVDHIVPFAKSGDHSIKNLRVVPKHFNLSRGARMPGLLDFLGRKPKLDLPPQQSNGSIRSGIAPARRLGRIAVAGILVVFLWHLARSEKRPTVDPLTVSAAPGAEQISVPIVTSEPTDPKPIQTQEPTSLAPETEITSTPNHETGDSVNSGQAIDSNADKGVSESVSTDFANAVKPDNKELTYSTGEVFAMYKADKRQADKALKGNTVDITGLIRKLGKTELSLRDPSDADSVQCRFETRDAGRLQALALGMKITVRGRVRGRTLTGNIQLEGCELSGSNVP